MAEHNGRLLEALKQFQNDGRLLSDLTDGAALVVLAWLEDEVRAAISGDEATFAAGVGRCAVLSSRSHVRMPTIRRP